MTDKRSTDVVDYIIDNNGAKPPLELVEKAYAASNTAAYASYATYAASDAASGSYVTHAAADAADAAAAEGYDAKEKNRNQTADICRQYLPLKMWEK
jgi:hypothetical protein